MGDIDKNHPLLAGVVSPALTTCHVPRAEMGSRSVMMLLNGIDDEIDRCDKIVIKLELVIRNSIVMEELANY